MCLTRDAGGNGDGGAKEREREEGAKEGVRTSGRGEVVGREKRRRSGTQNSLRAVVGEERRWNFYNDTFCARDYFRDVPAGFEERRG